MSKTTTSSIKPSVHRNNFREPRVQTSELNFTWLVTDSISLFNHIEHLCKGDTKSRNVGGSRCLTHKTDASALHPEKYLHTERHTWMKWDAGWTSNKKTDCRCCTQWVNVCPEPTKRRTLTGRGETDSAYHRRLVHKVDGWCFPGCKLLMWRCPLLLSPSAVGACYRLKVLNAFISWVCV